MLRVLFVSPVGPRDQHVRAIHALLGHEHTAITAVSPANPVKLLREADAGEWDVVVAHSCSVRVASALHRHVHGAQWLIPVWDRARTPRGESHPVLVGYDAAA